MQPISLESTTCLPTSFLRSPLRNVEHDESESRVTADISFMGRPLPEVSLDLRNQRRSNRCYQTTHVGPRLYRSPSRHILVARRYRIRLGLPLIGLGPNGATFAAEGARAGDAVSIVGPE